MRGKPMTRVPETAHPVSASGLVHSQTRRTRFSHIAGAATISALSVGHLPIRPIETASI